MNIQKHKGVVISLPYALLPPHPVKFELGTWRNQCLTIGVILKDLDFLVAFVSFSYYR